MGKKTVLSCPHCNSGKVVRNGHHYGGKLHYLCNSCSKHFTGDVAKGYPVSKIPFPVVAYFLYFRKKIPGFSNMRKYRRFVNQWLKCLGLKEKDLPRQTLHHWINNYEKNLEKIISFQEARGFFHELLADKLKGVPDEVIRSRGVSYTDALRFLEDALGREFVVDLIRRDEAVLVELCNLVSKYPVYCWRMVDEEGFRRFGDRFFLVRS